MKKIYLLNKMPFKGVINLEVSKIKFIKKKIDLKKFDGLIFTSKNAVYSINEFNKSWTNMDCFAISINTAKIVKKLGGKVKFVGKNSHGDSFAQELFPLLKNKQMLYLRAKKIVSNLTKIIIENGFNIKEEIIYETLYNKDLDANIENNSVIIFTSPSSVEFFFKKYSWNKTLKAVVIGQTTARYLPKEVEYSLSPNRSIKECVKLAKSI